MILFSSVIFVYLYYASIILVYELMYVDTVKLSLHKTILLVVVLFHCKNPYEFLPLQSVRAAPAEPARLAGSVAEQIHLATRHDKPAAQSQRPQKGQLQTAGSFFKPP